MVDVAHSPGNAGERPGTSGLAETVPASWRLRDVIRKWLCKKFNLVGAETVFTVELQGRIYEKTNLETVRVFEALYSHLPKPERKFPQIVTFDWKP